jgi:hypothetical protein
MRKQMCCRETLRGSGFNDTLSDFVSIGSDGSGNDLLQVDQDRTSSSYSMAVVTKLASVTGLDASTLVTNGNLVL